jgi:SSS family solute:Na+ symporter
VSLLMKVGALAFALELNRTFSINLQLLGGIWIVQTFPAVVIGLYTRWFHRFALITGWAVAMFYGTVQAYRTSGGGQAHFGGSATPVFGHVIYIAIAALILNVAVSALFTVVFRALGAQDGYDETRPSDYIADPDPSPAPHPASHGARHRAARASAGSHRSSPRPDPPI